MNLKKTDFSKQEKDKRYKLTTFVEQGVKINMLTENVSLKKIPSGNFYKFGLIENGNHYWLFNGISVANSRDKMIEIFSALNISIDNQNTTVFAYKSIL